MNRRGANWITLGLMAGVLAAPLAVFTGVFGLRFGWWGRDVALTQLALGYGPWLLAFGGLCALVLLWRARRDVRRTAPWALAAVLIVGTGAWLYAADALRQGRPALHDVATDIGEPPVFSQGLLDRRAASGAEATGTVAACPGVASLTTQVRAEEASAALQDAGFVLAPSSLFRVEATHRGFWFMMEHDVVVRIRPGRTDVRVSARRDRGQGDEACRLLAAAVNALQARSR